MESVDIALQHGRSMYRFALAHAINIMEIDPEGGLELLKAKLATLEKEGGVDHE